MTSKSFGKTVLGWFVVAEDEDGNVVEEAPPPAPPPPPARRAPAPAPPRQPARGEAPKVAPSGAGPNFASVYREAGIDDEERERVDRAITLVDSLPKETPTEVKRQIVEASLKAFGLPVDEIIEAGAQEIQALEAFIQKGAKELEASLTDGSARIEELTEQIATLRQQMEQRMQLQQRLTSSCNQQKLRVQAVLEFFGPEKIAAVVKRSPKLTEPE